MLQRYVQHEPNLAKKLYAWWKHQARRFEANAWRSKSGYGVFFAMTALSCGKLCAGLQVSSYQNVVDVNDYEIGDDEDRTRWFMWELWIGCRNCDALDISSVRSSLSFKDKFLRSID